MESIEIPLPDFGFDEIAKEKAKFIIHYILHGNSLFQYFSGGNSGLEDRLKNSISELYEDYERLICIVELLNFLIIEENKLKDNLTFSMKGPSFITTGLNRIRYVLYSLAKYDANYSFDRNTFSNEEVFDIESKINDIIFKLEKLEVGQEVIFDEVDKVKSHISSEFNSLKSLPVLGKKTFYQLVFGKIATFTGNKIADEIFEKLTPSIIALLASQDPNLVAEFHKLLK